MPDLIEVVLSKPDRWGNWRARIRDEGRDLDWTGWSSDRQTVIHMADEYLIGTNTRCDFVVVDA